MNYSENKIKELINKVKVIRFSRPLDGMVTNKMLVDRDDLKELDRVLSTMVSDKHLKVLQKG